MDGLLINPSIFNLFVINSTAVILSVYLFSWLMEGKRPLPATLSDH